MPTAKQKEIDERPYLKDSELYSLWKYLNGNLTSRAVFQFEDLLAPNASKLSIWFLLDRFESWGVTLENPVSNKDIYLNFYGKRALKTKMLQKICPKGFNVPEIKRHFSVLKKSGVLDFIEFDKKLSKRNKEIVYDFLNSYIDAFMEDKLKQKNTNFLKFDAQKQKTMDLLNDHEVKYGSAFVLKYDPAEAEYPSGENDYLFIHSIVALEKLGVIEVEEAWSQDEVPPEKQTNDFKIRLTVIGPADQEKKRFNPELKIEGTTGFFKFYKEGKKIKIGNIKSRRYRLLKVLMDQPGKAKSIDYVFEAIAIQRDKKNSALNDPFNTYLAKESKIKTIKFTLKELQSTKGLTGKVSLDFYDNNNTVALRLIS